jgi:hypothetical protein
VTFAGIPDLLNLEVDLLFFDTTSTYLEVDDFFRLAGITIDNSADETWPCLGTPAVAL